MVSTVNRIDSSKTRSRPEIVAKMLLKMLSSRLDEVYD